MTIVGIYPFCPNGWSYTIGNSHPHFIMRLNRVVVRKLENEERVDIRRVPLSEGEGYSKVKGNMKQHLSPPRKKLSARTIGAEARKQIGCWKKQDRFAGGVPSPRPTERTAIQLEYTSRCWNIWIDKRKDCITVLCGHKISLYTGRLSGQRTEDCPPELVLGDLVMSGRLLISRHHLILTLPLVGKIKRNTGENEINRILGYLVKTHNRVKNPSREKPRT